MGTDLGLRQRIVAWREGRRLPPATGGVLAAMTGDAGTANMKFLGAALAYAEGVDGGQYLRQLLYHQEEHGHMSVPAPPGKSMPNEQFTVSHPQWVDAAACGLAAAHKKGDKTLRESLETWFEHHLAVIEAGWSGGAAGIPVLCGPRANKKDKGPIAYNVSDRKLGQMLLFNRIPADRGLEGADQIGLRLLADLIHQGKARSLDLWGTRPLRFPRLVHPIHVARWGKDNILTWMDECLEMTDPGPQWWGAAVDGQVTAGVEPGNVSRTKGFLPRGEMPKVPDGTPVLTIGAM